MYCFNCGSALKDGYRFCPNCGAPNIALRLPIANRSEAAPTDVPTVPVPAKPAAAPVSEPTKKMKSAYSRAGLSTLALYGTMSAGSSIAGVLIMILTAVLGTLGKLIMDRPDNPAQWIENIFDQVEQSGIVLPSMLIYLLCAAGATVAGIFVMRKIMKRGTPIEKHSLSLGRFLLIALMCFGVWGVGAALGNLVNYAGVEQGTSLTDLLGKDIWPYLVYAVIGAPILEELAFRKTLLDRLHDYGEGYAAVISALLFGLMHGNHMQFFLAFFIGLIFAMVYQRTGRIIYTMILHAMINFTASVPELFAIIEIDVDLWWNIIAGVLVVGGLITLLIMRKDPLLHTAKCTVTNANRAAYKNVGMRIVRIAGLVLIGAYGILSVFMPMLNDPNPAYLLGLIPVSLVFLTVLLLPVFTKRYEAKLAPAEPITEPIVNQMEEPAAEAAAEPMEESISELIGKSAEEPITEAAEEQTYEGEKTV